MAGVSLSRWTMSYFSVALLALLGAEIAKPAADLGRNVRGCREGQVHARQTGIPFFTLP